LAWEAGEEKVHVGPYPSNGSNIGNQRHIGEAMSQNCAGKRIQLTKKFQFVDDVCEAELKATNAAK
jgi:hypothetical protein